MQVCCFVSVGQKVKSKSMGTVRDSGKVEKNGRKEKENSLLEVIIQQFKNQHRISARNGVWFQFAVGTHELEIYV